MGLEGRCLPPHCSMSNFPETVIKQISAAAWQLSQPSFVGRKLGGGDLSEVIVRLDSGFLMAHGPFAFKKMLVRKFIFQPVFAFAVRGVGANRKKRRKSLLGF